MSLLEPLGWAGWWIALGAIIAASMVVAGARRKSGRSDRPPLAAVAIGVTIWLLLTPVLGAWMNVVLLD
ncbi:MAG: hypothetical protein EXQ70_10085 [Solirubrobacterales bacterium]|nr:hypothetical protein [Solirubrobacterales bacterium]